MRRNLSSGVIAAIISIMLAVALILVCGIGSSWFTNSDVATWFNSWGNGDVAEEKPADEDVNTTTVACSEHVFNDQGICTNCGKGVDEVSYNLDVVTKDCAVRFFVGEEKKYESFGIGTNGYTISDIYDNVTVTATSTLSDSTLINVYKCTYSEDGEYEGYPAEGDNVLFEGKKYDKELVYTLSATKPVYTFENSEAADCLYIFEIVKA